MDMNQVRRMNLRRLVTENDGMTNLAKRLGLKRGAYISQLLTEPPVRTISEKTARSWEHKLELPANWMDGGTHATPVARGIDTATLVKVMNAVDDALKAAKVSLTTERYAELVAMQYADASTTGQVDHDRLRMIVGLIKR